MSALNQITNYFNLKSDLITKSDDPENLGRKTPPIWPQYLALVLGIIVQPYFAHYQTTGVWEITGMGGRTIFALIVGIAIFPAVFKNSLDPEKPIFVQFCTIFVSGMGWESLLAAALT